MSTKEIIINDIKIKYLENINKNSVEPIFVFLHGWGANFQTFSPIYSNLNNYIAFDFPGFGGSSKLQKEWNLLDYTKFTKNFLDKKLKNKTGSRQIIFVAHSFGGRVLVNLLNEYKLENVQQIICIGVPFVREYTLKQKMIQGITKIIKPLFSVMPKSLEKNMRKKWYKVIGASDYIELENEIMQNTFQNIINEDISESALILKNYKTTFIWGENDQEAPLIHAKLIAEKVDADLKVLKNSGHFPFIERNEEFMEVFDKKDN